ncbi:hypothetical protein E2C01_095706 [Portunus trituberculatus]|uniref:Uncharacterized protein n=1 Tax=Portunus trituberculatus TaxID=210409 RepID=A0A5B7K033_PORTR|nr:hypothetical protein [Portunus trituberculatus]
MKSRNSDVKSREARLALPPEHTIAIPATPAQSFIQSHLLLIHLKPLRPPCQRLTPPCSPPQGPGEVAAQDEGNIHHPPLLNLSCSRFVCHAGMEERSRVPFQ